MMSEKKISVHIKDRLEKIMHNHLTIFRDVLANLHQEERFLLRDPEMINSPRFIESRNELFESLEHSNHCLESALKAALHIKIVDKAASTTENGQFLEIIEELRESLSDSDFELILLCEQMIRVFEEIFRAVGSVLSALEHKSFANYHTHLKKLETQPAKSKLAVSVIDYEPESSYLNSDC